MAKPKGAAPHLAAALGTVLGTGTIPVRIRAWDKSEAGPENAPLLVMRSRRALRRIVWSPSQIGLGRAYVAGEIEVPGDIFATFAALSSVGKLAGAGPAGSSRARERWSLFTTAARYGAVGPEPAPPPEEAKPRRSRRHSKRRDAAAISHHYDVGNDFYRLVLGPTMVYSCAVWTAQDTGLDAAQEAKIDLICHKLGLRPGMRVLDVGCGWGSFALRAAQNYGADVVGVTLSAEQAKLARKRAADVGLTEQVDIRIQDYRDVNDGPFDAIASIGMAEHVGRNQMAGYASRLHSLLRPGGRLLNHAISWNAGRARYNPDTFIARYVFPDGELLKLADMVAELEAGEFEVLDVEALRQHYALTLRAWVKRLDRHWDEAVASTSEGRARVWRLYMAASAQNFEAGKLGVNQILVQRSGGDAPPLRRSEWV